MSFRRTILLLLTGFVLTLTGIEVLLDLAWEARQRSAFPPGFQEVSPRDDGGGLLLDLLDVPIVVAMALLAAGWLARRVERPIERLTRAADALADARRPDAVPVPPGDDALADLARAFNRMSASVHDSLERERAFTRYVSHELRTPLTAVRLQLERAEMGLVDARDVLPTVSRQASRMQEVLDALLALARSSRRDLAPRPLAPLIEEVIDAVGADVRSPAPLPRIRVSDAPLLAQALRNLVENTVQHASGRAELRASIRGRELDLVLRDEGPGLPDDLIARAHEPFVRGSAGTGSGLGLALVGQVAETLGGSLRLTNVDGGLEARLTLPVVAQASGR
jgi:signal transduction histidine kinase